MLAFEEPSILNAIFYDSVALNGNQQTYSFFEDEDDIEGSRHHEVAEGRLVKWILQNPYDPNCSLLNKELGLSGTHHFFTEGTGPLIRDTGIPGDIDLLAVHPTHPELSIGIQVKRIKAIISSDNVAEMKLKGIQRGVDQTRYMFNKYRFHKNYLLLILVADTTNRMHLSQPFRNICLDEKKPYYHHSSFTDLPDQAGIITYEISQPSKNSIQFTGFLGCKTLKPARTVDQLSQTTESIVALLKMSEVVL